MAYQLFFLLSFPVFLVVVAENPCQFLMDAEHGRNILDDDNPSNSNPSEEKFNLQALIHTADTLYFIINGLTYTVKLTDKRKARLEEQSSLIPNSDTSQRTVLESGVPWEKHSLTKCDMNVCEKKKGYILKRLNLVQYDKSLVKSWKHYYYAGEKTSLWVQGDNTRFMVEKEKAYRWFTALGDGGTTKGGYVLFYSQYMNYETIEENGTSDELETLAKNRRVLIAPMVNWRIETSTVYPLNFPQTEDSGKLQLHDDDLYYMETNEDRSTVIFKRYQKDATLQRSNEGDLFFAIPFGFIFGGRLYAFEPVMKTVIRFQLPEKTEMDDATAEIVSYKWSDMLCTPDGDTNAVKISQEEFMEKAYQKAFKRNVGTGGKDSAFSSKVLIFILVICGAIIMVLVWLFVCTCRQKRRSSRRGASGRHLKGGACKQTRSKQNLSTKTKTSSKSKKASRTKTTTTTSKKTATTASKKPTSKSKTKTKSKSKNKSAPMYNNRQYMKAAGPAKVIIYLEVKQ